MDTAFMKLARMPWSYVIVILLLITMFLGALHTSQVQTKVSVTSEVHEMDTFQGRGACISATVGCQLQFPHGVIVLGSVISFLDSL